MGWPKQKAKETFSCGLSGKRGRLGRQLTKIGLCWDQKEN